MPSFYNVVLDTTGPGGVTLALNGNAAYATTQAITAAINTTDTPTTGYQVKVWGSVDTADNASIQATEGASSWITPASFPANQAVKLSSGDGLKTINIKVRDDVWNESSVATKTITLDTTAPIVTINSGPDVTKISTVAGKRTVTTTWQSNEDFVEYKVKVVPVSGSVESAGTLIGSANGSTNVSATGTFPASSAITTTVDARDLQAASSADGVKLIKVFVKDNAGLWSVA